MNRYLVIDYETNTIFSTHDLKYLINDEFDEFGGSITCINRYDLIEELKNVIKELEDLENE